MKVSNEQESWTATQVCALAATGLASSHLQPFTRILYDDPKSRGARVKGGRSRAVLVDVRDDGKVTCQRHRERNGKYTATWGSPNHLGKSDSSEVFHVHSAVDWVELQLWNRFDNGLDVFLGQASISLRQLQQQCSETNGTTRNLTTGALWFPLQHSEANGLAHLSLQVEFTFTSDPKVRHIREEIQQRRKRNAKKYKKLRDEGSRVDQLGDYESGEEVDTSIVDPAFAFTQPFLPVEWSLIASTSVRHLFFHSDIERLANFRELILYGNLERELDEDEELQIHDDHLTAFKTCQFSAQYLDHCVENLSQRLQGYSDDYRALVDARRHLARKNKSLKAQRKRLQKEHDDLDLLISTYQSVLEKNGCTTSPDKPSSPIRDDSCPISPPQSPLISPTASLSSKKPVFLKTWEERERERRLEKEISKAQRIEEEKQRILQHVLDRQQRDDYEALISKFAENKRQRAARRIQTFFHTIQSALYAQRSAAEGRAATIVQAEWRRFLYVKKYPHQLEARKQENEMLLMAQNEREIRQWLADMELKQREEATPRAMSPPESIQSNGVDEVTSTPSASPSKQAVDALVATWRKLHRVFVRAHKTKGIDYHELFSEIDLRKDDVIDRAELRLGARSFGVRLDRKITRALITLIRTKCGAPSKPLLVTFEQFMTGFELMSQKVESAITIPPPETNLESPASGNENKITNPLDGTSSDGLPVKHKDETIDEEALIITVRALRAAVYESATAFLTALGKPSSDYRAFRDALTNIFSDFDVDKNGELDMDELVACITSFNLRLSNEKISLVRELFIGDRESEKIGVAEFISFVLAHASSFGEDELGLLGHRIRDQILRRVQQTQNQSGNVEDAVRLVFAAAYKRKDQEDCSIRDFVRVVNRMRLGITPAQLARLVVRLDRNNDRSISFDELLLWLRIRSKASSGGSVLTSSGRATILQVTTEKAKALRVLLENLAFALAPPDIQESKKANLTSLFRQIDRDNSGKINQEELQIFLNDQDLSSIVGQEILIQLCGISTLPQSPAALVAQEMISLVDLNANGVTTLKEWLTFAQFDNAQYGGDPVVVESVRKALKESESSDPERLLMWFSGLPGSIQAATPRKEEQNQMKIRVAEFKTALRVKLGGAHSVSMHTIDQAVESLDKDGSGWITTNELYTWVFPPRDLEALLRLVIICWQIERQQFAGSDFAVDMYHRFDVDNNGALAVRELIQGFVPFGLTLSEYESRVLLIAFDLDGDGCWRKSEFLAFVDKLFPTDSFVEEPVTTSVIPQYTDEAPDNSTIQASPHDGDEGSNSYGDHAYSDDDQLLEARSSNGLPSPAYSDEREVGVRPVHYSEDFDETSI